MSSTTTIHRRVHIEHDIEKELRHLRTIRKNDNVTISKIIENENTLFELQADTANGVSVYSPCQHAKKDNFLSFELSCDWKSKAKELRERDTKKKYKCFRCYKREYTTMKNDFTLKDTSDEESPFHFHLCSKQNLKVVSLDVEEEKFLLPKVPFFYNQEGQENEWKACSYIFILLASADHFSLESNNDGDFLNAVLNEAIMEEDDYELCCKWVTLSSKVHGILTLKDMEDLHSAIDVFIDSDIQGGKYNHKALSFIRNAEETLSTEMKKIQISESPKRLVLYHFLTPGENDYEIVESLKGIYPVVFAGGSIYILCLTSKSEDIQEIEACGIKYTVDKQLDVCGVNIIDAEGNSEYELECNGDIIRSIDETIALKATDCIKQIPGAVQCEGITKKSVRCKNFITGNTKCRWHKK